MDEQTNEITWYLHRMSRTNTANAIDATGHIHYTHSEGNISVSLVVDGSLNDFGGF